MPLYSFFLGKWRISSFISPICHWHGMISSPPFLHCYYRGLRISYCCRFCYCFKVLWSWMYYFSSITSELIAITRLWANSTEFLLVLYVLVYPLLCQTLSSVKVHTPQFSSTRLSSNPTPKVITTRGSAGVVKCSQHSYTVPTRANLLHFRAAQKVLRFRVPCILRFVSQGYFRLLKDTYCELYCKRWIFWHF